MSRIHQIYRLAYYNLWHLRLPDGQASMCYFAMAAAYGAITFFLMMISPRSS